MKYSVTNKMPDPTPADCLIVGVFENGLLSTSAQQLDDLSGGYLTKLLKNGDMQSEIGQTLLLYQVPHLATSRLLLVNCGKKETFNEIAFRKALASAAACLAKINIHEAICCLPTLPVNNRSIVWKVRETVEAFENSHYQFDTFKTQKPSKKPHLHTLMISIAATDKLTDAEQGMREGQAIADAMKWVKDLGNMPSNICTPTYIAEQALQFTQQYPALSATILEKNDMEKLGMGALLAVAKGSHQPPKLIVLKYQGGKEDEQPIALVGKGVTFDSGGISLKGRVGMDEMKYDMCGAATVLGAIKVAATLQLPINIVGIMPTTENMPGGGANKPGDVVTTCNGQTIEILDTDAEGRLILSDALAYSTRFNPAVIIDIATLTGAMIITLGSIASGLMSNNESLSEDLIVASKECSDLIWQFPLWEEYQELIDSQIADVVNLGENAKSIAAACLLSRFVNNYPWAHLDIAGTAWNSGKNKGATGRPVPLLTQYLINYVKRGVI